MTKVKVHRISYLENYSTALTSFAEHYRTDFSSITQHFTSGLIDEKGRAINAFFNKLSDLQSQVFTTYPAAIDNCASVISSYASNLKGADFNEICWSNTDGINTVATKLTGEQVDEIETIRSGLASLMDSAAETAGITSLSSNLNPFKSTAETELTAHSKARTDKHSTVETAFTSFTSGLDSANGNLSTANSLITHAKLVSSIPPKTILQSINNGRLSAEKMYYLDMIQDESDPVLALFNIYTYLDGADSKELNNPDSEVSKNISAEMDKITSAYNMGDEEYAIVADQLSTWIGDGNKQGQYIFNKMLESLGKQPVEQNTKFYTGLGKGIYTLAVANQTTIIAMLQTPEYAADNSVIDPFVSKENSLNELMAFINTLSVMRYGQIKQDTYTDDLTTTNTIESHKRTQYHDVTGKIYYKDGVMYVAMMHPNLTPEWDNFWQGTVTETRKVELATNEEEYQIDENFMNYELLSIKEREAALDMVREVLASGLDLATAGLGDDLAGVSRLVQAVIAGNAQQLGEVAAGHVLDKNKEQAQTQRQKAHAKALENFHNSMGKATDIMGSVLAYQKTIEKLDVDQRKLVQEIRSDYLGQGGVLMTGDDSHEATTYRQFYYDYRVTLRQNELDQHGVTGFLDSDSNNYDITKEAYRKALDKNKSISPEMKQYLLGEGETTNLRFETMDYEQLTELRRGIDALSNTEVIRGGKTIQNSQASGDFQTYLNSKYSEYKDIPQDLARLEGVE